MAYKEIVTKAVIGKGKKKYKNTYEITVDQKPTTILGCWIINHNFEAKENNNKINIDGSYDVNIWYSYDNDTKTTVVNKKISYHEEEELVVNEKNIINKDIIIRCLKQPVCIKATEDGNIIKLEIEKELGIEIIGDTKVKIASVDDTEDTWKDLNEEEINDEKNIIEDINTEYIDKEIIK